MSNDKIWNHTFLEECFDINLPDGTIVWRVRPLHHFKNSHGMNIFNSRWAGRPVYEITKKGYNRARINGRHMYVHRIMFFIQNGYLPKFVDHIDGNPLNNSITNLREASSKQNNRNRKSKKATSKYKGVSWSLDKQKWVVFATNEELGVSTSGKAKQKFLGYYELEEDAAKAYDKYAEIVHGEFAWLNKDNFAEVSCE